MTPPGLGLCLTIVIESESVLTGPCPCGSKAGSALALVDILGKSTKNQANTGKETDCHARARSGLKSALNAPVRAVLFLCISLSSTDRSETLSCHVEISSYYLKSLTHLSGGIGRKIYQTDNWRPGRRSELFER
ncbi:hypothetical protein EVAR_65835_1 [Eumeta japonica]|uniref:Uncharacterized protein n=1 Tax=Eumeta variegata TaxID=151549 RepID=A0A4C1ZNE1_EUMVA|nr:hypothetical protein EVAR_65835_1 [Eumeta japonica]